MNKNEIDKALYLLKGIGIYIKDMWMIILDDYERKSKNERKRMGVPSY